MTQWVKLCFQNRLSKPLCNVAVSLVISTKNEYILMFGFRTNCKLFCFSVAFTNLSNLKAL